MDIGGSQETVVTCEELLVSSESAMTVLHILDHSLPVQSGYAFRAHAILSAQQRTGLNALALTSPKHNMNRSGYVKPEEEIDAIRYCRSPATWNSGIPLAGEIAVMGTLARSLWRLVRRNKPCVLHAHSPTLNVLPSILVAKAYRIPVVYEVRSSWEDAAADRGTYGVASWKYKVGKRLETWACKTADALVVICEGLRHELVERGIPTEKVTVVPNGVNIDLFDPRKVELLKDKKFRFANRKVIGFMGSFFRWEGLELLVDAMAQLAQTRSDVLLLLVGGGEMDQELRDRVRRHRLEEHVVLPGQVTQDQIPALYAGVDIMAFPRHSTRLTEMVTPLKPLEAMAMRKTIVASDVGGHRELIHHGQTGLLFQAGSVDALVASLCQVLDDKDLRESLQERGFSWVRRERVWSKTTQPYLELYRKLSL
jgi:PEP-CTERM/exosortase A-associated glycosyltransferase